MYVMCTIKFKSNPLFNIFLSYLVNRFSFFSHVVSSLAYLTCLGIKDLLLLPLLNISSAANCVFRLWIDAARIVSHWFWTIVFKKESFAVTSKIRQTSGQMKWTRYIHGNLNGSLKKHL
jgi:hypothetical protein